MERLTIRKEDGQAEMDCEACKKSGFACNLLGCRNRLKDRLAYYEDKAAQKQGRWVYDIETAIWGYPYLCSNCNKAHDHEERYCPNCGARMDKQLLY